MNALLVFNCIVITTVLGFTSAQLPPFSEECETKAYPPSSGSKIPTYVVNLNSPPQDRWTKLVTDKKSDIINLLALVKNISASLFEGKLIKIVDYYLPKLAKTLPYPFYDELNGIANATGLPLGEITLYNIFYEIFTVCTSIIAQDKDGKLYHARNMDFGLLMGWNTTDHSWEGTELLRKLIVTTDFQRDGKTLFQSVQFAGYVGVLTGVKQNMFTLTIDERFKLKGGFIGLIEWILGYRDGKWMGFLSRSVFENVTTYPEAQMILSEAKLLAPVYFILGGTSKGQGSIITRSFDTADIWNLGTNGSSWFLVETNYDHWETPPFYDDRRTPATKCLNKLTQENVTLGGLFNVLSTKPVRNKLTTYTSLMQVNDGHLETYIQYCSDPCWPF